MKRLLMIILATILICGITSAQDVSFRFEPGQLGDASLREKVEERITSLLSELTQASKAHRPLKLDSLYLSPRANKRLSNLWRNLHFSCEDAQIVERCLRDVKGYQVRNIFVTLQPTTNGYTGSISRELAIFFDSQGFVTGVNMALEDSIYHDIMNRAITVTDSLQRLEIIKSIEEFCNYYEEKDLEALKVIYSDKHLSFGDDILEYAKRDTINIKTSICKAEKEQYIRCIEKIFKDNEYVNMNFDKVIVYRANHKADFYGVTLHQEWNSDYSSNNGYMFLLWQFMENDDERACVQVRTWQPEVVNGHRLSPDEIYTVNDFFIP